MESKTGTALIWLDAWRLVSESWNSITTETIINCFIKANCMAPDLQRDLLHRTEKGRAKLAVMTDIMDVEEDWSDWTELDSGAVPAFIEAMDKLKINVQLHQKELTADNKALYPVVADAIFTAHDAGIEDTAKINAAKEIITVEDNSAVQEDIVEAVISQMELNLSFEQPVSEDAEQNDTEESRDLLLQQLLAGRDKAEKWLSTLAYVAGCDAQVDEVFKASTQFFDSLPKKQATLHSYFDAN